MTIDQFFRSGFTFAFAIKILAVKKKDWSIKKGILTMKKGINRYVVIINFNLSTF